MKKIKYIILILFISLLFPLVSDAASIALEEIDSDSKNVAKYNIVLKFEENEEPINSLSLKIEKTNSVENLKYSLKETDSNSISGSCDSNSLTCNLVTATISSNTTIATLTIANGTASEQATRINISGDLTSEVINVVLKEMPTTTTTTTMPTTTTTTTTKKILSNDNNLSNITVSVGNMDQEFNKEITTYNVTDIKDTVNAITVTPTCDNNCKWTITCPLGECTVSNSRRVSLQTGANKISISVTSEDEQNSKSYILNVYRGEIKKSSAYLTELEITGAELSPKFDSLTNDYTTTVGLDTEELEIIPTLEDPEAKVNIKGNEKLAEGENTITVTVTSSDGENKQVYTIIVTKEEIEEEPPVEEEKEEVPITKVEKKKDNKLLIIVISSIAILIIIIVFIMLFVKKKKKNDKNNKNGKNGPSNSKRKEELDELFKENIEKENTETLRILNDTKKDFYDEPKQDVDEALDDLMQTKRLELGDLGL